MALPHWIDFFDELQHVRGRSLNTVMAYRHDLEIYEQFLKKNSDISAIYEYLTKNGLKPRSQARVISSIRTYLKFCERQGDKVPNLRQLRPPKVKVGLPKAITPKDFKRLYDACETEHAYRTARNQITLLLLFGLGCRVTELINLDIHDFNQTEGWLRVLGKGGKERLVPLTQQLQKELEDYLAHVREELMKTKTTAVLINDKGNRPSRVDIWRWLAAWSAAAGFDSPVSPHRFRHGCATSLLEGGADLRSIQMLLGHSSIQTTQIYTSVSSSKIRDAVETHHPLAKLR
ncbi:MAG: tyrosine-type recombinase/integrase [Bdellovibrionales bacterium]|nr:tyrosine-type recombinase/integrase [Bdellovibrionales bacterium]